MRTTARAWPNRIRLIGHRERSGKFLDALYEDEIGREFAVKDITQPLKELFKRREAKQNPGGPLGRHSVR
jgi:hypothetical protein